jgi:outer membrane protein OmpA-like peptidoglycan-associated protein
VSGDSLASRRTAFAVARLVLSGVLLVSGLAFAWERYRHFRGNDAEAATQQASSTLPVEGREIHLRVAGDAWPGYAPFRGEPVLKATLRAHGYQVRYVLNPVLDAPQARLQALVAGEIDVALVPLASLVRFASTASEAVPVVQFVVDESTGGDALLLNPDAEVPAQFVKFESCTSPDGANDALLRFASQALPDTFSQVSPVAPVNSQVQCLEQMRKGNLHIAALRNPYAALARSEGQHTLLSSRELGAHLNFDVAVSRRDVNSAQRSAIRELARAYFASTEHWRAEPTSATHFLNQDCAGLCAKDGALGAQFLSEMRLFDLKDNGCVWFGACPEGGSLLDAVRDLAKLYSDHATAKTHLEHAESLFDTAALLDLANESGLRFAEAPAVVSVAAGTAPATAGSKVGADSRPESGGVSHYDIPPLDRKAAAAAYLGRLALPQIEFAPGSFQLDATAQTQLQGWARYLWRFPGECLRVTGYSTAKEEPEPDHRLSRVRAQAVARELTRLQPQSFPESRFEIVAQRAETGVVNARSVEIGVLRCKVW